MQATFHWDGAARPVAEVLDEMLDGCADGLAALGASRPGLGVINGMVHRRVCQADYALTLAERYRDPVLLASAYRKLARHWTAFDEWLETAPTLEPAPLPDERAVLDEHLSHVAAGTHFYRLHWVMHFPAPRRDEIIEQLVREGLITKEFSVKRGTLLHRRG